MMRERGIIFTAESVRAILEGRKTQTRRIVKPPHDFLIAGGATLDMLAKVLFEAGMRLWVRETWSTSATGVYPCPRAWFRADFGKHDDPLEESKFHNRDCSGNSADCFACAAEREGKFRWRSPLYMSRNLSRITLEITEVRVERLNEISNADAVAEGTPCWVCGRIIDGLSEGDCECFHTTSNAAASYSMLWDSIHGSKCPWSSNPFVWAISFRKVEAA